MSTRSTTGTRWAATGSGVLFLPVFPLGLPRVYHGHFFREKPYGFSRFFALSDQFSPCKGRYAFLNYTSFLKVGKWQLILEGISAPA